MLRVIEKAMFLEDQELPTIDKKYRLNKEATLLSLIRVAPERKLIPIKLWPQDNVVRWFSPDDIYISEGKPHYKGRPVTILSNEVYETKVGWKKLGRLYVKENRFLDDEKRGEVLLGQESEKEKSKKGTQIWPHLAPGERGIPGVSWSQIMAPLTSGERESWGTISYKTGRENLR